MDHEALKTLIHDPLVEYARKQIREHMFQIKRFRQAGPFYLDISGKDRAQPICSIKFRVRNEDVHAKREPGAKAERSFALDGIEVEEAFKRQGVFKTILRALACSFREEPYCIRAVVFNPISDEMEQCLDHMGVANRSGTAVVWDSLFDDRLI